MTKRFSSRPAAGKGTLLICSALTLSLILGAFSGCGTQKQEEFASAGDVADKAIEEFLSLTDVPRPSFHTEKALAYLQSFAERHGLAHYHDAYGNFWMDIPAAKGYEGYPKVILQAHMDMVCVSDPGVDVDYETTGITAVVGEDTITADGTSLGADDGVGVGTILALIESNTAHGPLRALITTDEEVGMLGAAALEHSAIDSDYLINIDGEQAGQLCYSTAGGLQSSAKKQYATHAVGSDETVWELEVGNLLGGHSGIEIDKGRLSAVTALTELLQGVMDAGISVSLISAYTGTAGSVISPSGSVSFAIPVGRESELADIVQNVQGYLASRYPNEDMECTLRQRDSDGITAASPEDSAEMIALVRSFPQGVISMSEKVDGLVETSSNTGVFTLTEGSVEIGAISRSCVTEELDRLETDLRALSEKSGYSYTTVAKFPGWDGDPDAPLVKLTAQAYSETGTTPELIAVHAGIECAWFTTMREGIQMVCIGPDVVGAHTTGETLKPKTVEPMVAALLYCLSNIDSL